jgi:hypothetical protein
MDLVFMPSEMHEPSYRSKDSEDEYNPELQLV